MRSHEVAVGVAHIQDNLVLAFSEVVGEVEVVREHESAGFASVYSDVAYRVSACELKYGRHTLTVVIYERGLEVTRVERIAVCYDVGDVNLVALRFE